MLHDHLIHTQQVKIFYCQLCIHAAITFLTVDTATIDKMIVGFAIFEHRERK